MNGRTTKLLLLAFWIAVSAGFNFAGPQDDAAPAGLVLKNGFVYTVDGRRTVAAAVAVRDGKIVLVGSDRDAAKYIGSGTVVIDLRGRMVLPGFIDSHCHAAYGAAHEGFDIMFTGLKSIDEYKKAIRDFACRAPGREVHQGPGLEEHPVRQDRPRQEDHRRDHPGHPGGARRRGRARHLGELADPQAGRHHQGDKESARRGDRARSRHRRADGHAARGRRRPGLVPLPRLYRGAAHAGHRVLPEDGRLLRHHHGARRHARRGRQRLPRLQKPGEGEPPGHALPRLALGGPEEGARAGGRAHRRPGEELRPAFPGQRGEGVYRRRGRGRHGVPEGTLQASAGFPRRAPLGRG